MGDEADSQHLQEALNKMLDTDFRRKCSENALQLGTKNRPAKTIAEIVFAEIFSEGAT